MFGCFVIVIGDIVVSVIDCYWLSVGRLVLFYLVGKDVFVSCKARSYIFLFLPCRHFECVNVTYFTVFHIMDKNT